MWAGSGLQVQSPTVWYLALGDLEPGKYWPGLEGVVGDMDSGLVRGLLTWFSPTPQKLNHREDINNLGC